MDDTAPGRPALDPAASHRLVPSRLERVLHLAALRRQISILLLAEHDFELRSHTALRRLNEQGYLDDGARQTLATISRSAASCRDALAAELLLIAAAYVGSITVVFGAASVDAAPAGVSAARLWYGLCALPLFQLIVFRALWRWLCWARVLVGWSRLRLRLIATHPDRRGALGFPEAPSLRFFALFQLALSCTLSATWAMRLSGGLIKADAIKNLFAIYFLIALALVYAPLLLFGPQLDRLAHDGDFAFGGLTVDYVRRFEQRWLTATERPNPLGAPDFNRWPTSATAIAEPASVVSEVFRRALGHR